MMWGESVYFQCFSVGGGAVAFVAVPLVLRKFFVDVMHVFVAVRFCQDAGSRDGREFPIALDHAGMLDFGIGLEAIAIDQ